MDSYTKISNEVIEKIEMMQADGVLESVDIAVLLTICRFSFQQKSGKRNICMKNYKQISEMLGKSKVTVIRSVKRLKKAGLVDIVHRVKRRGRDVRLTRDIPTQLKKAKFLTSHFQVKF